MTASDDRLQRTASIQRLFERALEVAEEQRAGFLAEACDGDDDLRDEVLELLGALGRAGGFLVEPAADDGRPPGAVLELFRQLRDDTDFGGRAHM